MSFDLLPCHYCSGGYLKNRVYAAPLQALEKFQGLICRVVNFLRNNPGIIRKAVGDTIQRCGLYLDRRGDHIESIGA